MGVSVSCGSSGGLDGITAEVAELKVASGFGASVGGGG